MGLAEHAVLAQVYHVVRSPISGSDIRPVARCGHRAFLRFMLGTGSGTILALRVRLGRSR